MSDYQALRFEKTGRIAHITLHRPDAAHGVDTTMARELAHVAAVCDRDRELKAVVLTGSGRFFCAGGDLKAMLAEPDRHAYVKALANDVHAAVSTFARMQAPLIVAVNGIAAGAGFSLAVVGDLVVAAESASFTMAYTRAGVSPDGSASYYLPRLIGLRRTQELMYTNRTLSAREALDWNLVNAVVPDDALAAHAEKWAAMFAEGPRQSNAQVKKLLLTTFDNPLETQMEIEGRGVAACAGSVDGGEGMTAFATRRSPTFE